MFTSLRRVIKSGLDSFSRDGGLAAANIFIMVMTISVITSIFLFQDVSRFLIASLQEKVDISAYFKYEASEEEILEVKEELSQLTQVKEVEYVSKEEALTKFSERHQDDPVLMESLEEVGYNPFLASLNIKAFNPGQYEEVAGFLEDSSYGSIIEKVDYYQRKPVIERIFALTSNLNTAGIILSLVLVIVAILVAFNSVRLAIYNCREEIKIQRLVGASNWFIRGPFLVQGAVTGAFSALITLFLFTFLSWILNTKIGVLFPDLSLFGVFLSNFWLILLIQLVAGIGLGMVSSLIAIRRYLRI
jgi:cell division transport system permease protein